MRIAFITPEAPPFSGGGIATFINNITKGMSEAGIYCEVFAPADGDKTEITTLNGVPIHRIAVADGSVFRKEVTPYFLSRHAEVKFTIIESCEIHASLYELMQEKLPGLKYVIRVQMPVVQQLRLNNYYVSFGKKLRYVLGALRRFKWDLGAWNSVDVKRKNDPEYLVCKKADAIIAPSQGFKDWLTNFWRLPGEKITIIPHLFNFSTLPVNEYILEKEKDKPIRILFTGKLNAHKGVINMAKAADIILKEFSNVEFILIGEDWPTNYWNRTLPTSEIIRQITHHHPNIQILGKVPYTEIGKHYRESDICIFPSLWEAWGYTCTEAMSMGKAVIGSKYGGMADAIENGKNGLLIDPFDVKDIISKLKMLITNPALREKLGDEAKKTIQKELSFQELLQQNISFYKSLLSNSPDFA